MKMGNLVKLARAKMGVVYVSLPVLLSDVEGCLMCAARGVGMQIIICVFLIPTDDTELARERVEAAVRVCVKEMSGC